MEAMAETEEHSSAATEKPVLRNPPCDQCRRRKVKCDSEIPCDRCIQSGLRCTRDIARKRRGPKKGSGSVIAKLRDETDQSLLGNVALPQYDLPPLIAGNGLPGLYRTSSGESTFSSASGAYVSGFAPRSHPGGSDPTQLPSAGRGTQDIGPLAGVSQYASPTTDLDSPLPWRLADPYANSQYPSPGSSGYVTVNELAHKIFDDTDPPSLAYHSDNNTGMTGPETFAQPQNTPVRHTSIDAILSAAVESARSPPTHSTSPGVHNLQHMLARTTSSPSQVESQLATVAVEIGVSPNLMSQCVEQYFLHLYPIMPVIHEASFYSRLIQQEPLPLEEKCLLVALCAMTVLKTAPASELNFNAKKDMCRQFLSQVLEIRKQGEWIESATLTSIITSYCIAVAHWELKQYRSHCLYLREAVGLALEHGLHLESSYPKLTRTQEICHRRTFALLFVTERGLAILRNKPIMITRLPYLPTEHFDDEDTTILSGFQCICQLFSLLDEKFVELWRQVAPEVEGTSSTVQNLAAIQHDLNTISFETSGLSDIQKADVLITQQWLRLIFWQASMRQGLVSSASQDPVFYYDYPISIAKTLCEMMSKLPINAVIVHGSGIVCTVTHSTCSLC